MENQPVPEFVLYPHFLSRFLSHLPSRWKWERTHCGHLLLLEDNYRKVLGCQQLSANSQRWTWKPQGVMLWQMELKAALIRWTEGFIDRNVDMTQICWEMRHLWTSIPSWHHPHLSSCLWKDWKRGTLAEQWKVREINSSIAPVLTADQSSLVECILPLWVPVTKQTGNKKLTNVLNQNTNYKLLKWADKFPALRHAGGWVGRLTCLAWRIPICCASVPPALRPSQLWSASSSSHSSDATHTNTVRIFTETHTNMQKFKSEGAELVEVLMRHHSNHYCVCR